MADSALEAIEESVVTDLLLVPGMASARAVPLSLAFKFKEREDGTVELEHHELPYVYDGAIVCVNDDAVQPAHMLDSPNSTLVQYRVPVVIAFYATSDGSVLGAAHRKVWALYEKALRRLCVLTPTGMPDGAQSMAPLKPGDYEAIPIDAHTHGIAAHFYAHYQIEVTA